MTSDFKYDQWVGEQYDQWASEQVATDPTTGNRDRRGVRSSPNGDGIVIDLRSGHPRLFAERHSRWQLACKRAIDVVGASLAIALLSPILILTALLVAATSRGPVIFRQMRVGQHGQEFSFMKFRSMYVDAESRKRELLDLNDHESGPIFKIRDDPRITPLGRIIRKYSIDELPQLFHVLSGKMSLVGPRPPLPDEVQLYGPRELTRLIVKPGITCIWQVSGRSEVGFEDWMEMDIEYIRNWSLGLDLKLMVRTIWVVLSARGAY